MAEHTSGEWRTAGEVQVTPTGLMRATVRAETDIPDDGRGGPTHSSLLIAETTSFKPGVAEANARLFAAAPDLLEAAKRAERHLGRQVAYRNAEEDASSPSLDALQAAIRKAERGDAADTSTQRPER